ncbi:MAG: XTP/dITP diphosphatase [Candidatus Omnitrophota bacterium]
MTEKNVQTLIVASKNPGKLREIRELMAEFDLRVRSLADYPGHPEIVEDGGSFEENAAKKALTISRWTEGLVMGEDSGLEVDALEGRPGIYSARYSGEGATDESNNQLLLRELNDVPQEKRTARYRCAVVLSRGADILVSVEGTCEGAIAPEPAGSNGFGYDPLFFLPQYGRTFGQLDPQIKAQISHRAEAVNKFKDALRAVLPAC